MRGEPRRFKCHNVIDPLSGQPFQGNIIPASRLDPIIQKQIPYQPKPNFAVAADQASFPTYNTIGFPKRINDWDQYNARIDHHFSAKDVLYGTFSNSDETLIAPALRPLGGDVFPQTDRLWTATYNRIITPTMVNEFRFGYNRSLTYRTAETSNTKDYAKDDFGLKNTSPNPFDFGVPVFSPSGFSGVGSLSEAIGATDTNIQFTDNFSWNTAQAQHPPWFRNRAPALRRDHGFRRQPELQLRWPFHRDARCPRARGHVHEREHSARRQCRARLEPVPSG